MISATDPLSIFSWSRKFHRPLILDGAMGSYIQIKFPHLHHHGIWMNKVLTMHPEFVESLHEMYINAGADIITTFSFRTNPYSLKLHDPEHHTSEEMVKIAVDCCLKARNATSKDKLPVLIAGSNTTMVDCYDGNLSEITDQEIYDNHSKHIQNLINCGSDFILNETLGFFREIKIICEFCFTNKIPYVISIYCDGDLKLLSGEDVQEVVEYIKKYNPIAISFNCIKHSTMEKIIQKIDLKEISWGCYVNCGQEDMQEKFAEEEGEVDQSVLDFKVSPEDLSIFAEKIKNMGLQPTFIGSCCCSTPDHTEKLVKYFNSFSFI